MSVQRYFKILGIPPTKNEKLVKRAYRKKAMKYHPDRNSSASAKNKFIEVTEAYDKILLALQRAETSRRTTHSTDNRQRTTQRTHRKTTHRRTERTYQKTEQSNSQQQTANEAREERVKEARKRYEHSKRQEAEDNERYYQTMTSGKTWRKFKIIMFACSLLSLLMTLDLLYFPTSIEQSAITKKNKQIAYKGSDGGKTSPVIFDNGQKAWVSLSIIAKEERNFLYLERTFFFKEIKNVKIWRNNSWTSYPPDYSIINTYPLIHLFLLIPLLTYFLKAKTMIFSMLFHISFYFFPFVVLFVLISNDRWAHLLTLGLL